MRDMERKIFNDLKKWKDRKGRKPLILTGARQVGKSWAMKTFGERYYDNVAYINCDAEPMAEEIFASDYNIDRMLLVIQAITGIKVEPETTLIIFDEIQEAKRGLHSLKYFQENAPEYLVMAAGSLQGITLGKGESYPVGKVDMLQLYPMDFEEFLWAAGEQTLSNFSAMDWTSLNMLSTKYVDLLRQYYYVGGMPEVVSLFFESKDLAQVRTLQSEILNAYRNDISKHTNSTQSMKISQVLFSLPSQLAKENKKFIYGAIRKGARANEFELAIQWLLDAGLVYKVACVSELRMPLKFYEDVANFKLFFLDCGLLGCMAEAPASQMLVGDNVFREFKGAFTEQYTMQQLTALGYKLYYWSNKQSSAEIDFAIQTDGRVIPIEVKAEVNVKSKSMAAYISSHPEIPLKGLRISMLGYKDQGWMENIPLFGIQKYFAELAPRE